MYVCPGQSEEYHQDCGSVVLSVLCIKLGGSPLNHANTVKY